MLACYSGNEHNMAVIAIDYYTTTTVYHKRVVPS